MGTYSLTSYSLTSLRCRSVRVWDWQSGACVHTIHGITSNVLGVTAVLCLEGGAKLVAAADVGVFLFESCMH